MRIRSTSAIALLLCASLVHAAEPAAYKLEPGTMLTFEGTSESAGNYRMTSASTVTVWVLRRNDDGTYRVLLRNASSYRYNDQASSTNESWMMADLAADGRTSNEVAPSAYQTPTLPFPPLPRASGETWTRPSSAAGEFSEFRRGEGGDAGQLRLFQRQLGSMNKVYGVAHETIHTIDLARGLPVREDTTATQSWPSESTTTAASELKSVERIDDAAAATMLADAEAFFAAAKRYQSKMSDENADAAGLDAAKDEFVAATSTLQTPALKAAATEQVARHEGTAFYLAEDRAERAKRVGQPAPDWSLVDLDGKTVKLADLRGKVVLLDFWYRGCGWCIRAMPALNELAGDFAGRPVVILGINNDAKEEDARFVAREMGLKYPTLLGPEVPQAYGVRGFPTMILIDGEGVIREVHSGYTPTLRADFTAKIEKLLKS